MFSNREEHDFPLTPLGRQQAEQLASALDAEPVTRIYSRPVLRAVETAEIAARHLSTTVCIAPALREYDVGEFELQPYGGEFSWRMQRYRENEAAWLNGDTGHRLAGGESFDDLRSRFHPFIRWLIESHQPTDTVLLMGYGGLYRIMLPTVLQNVTAQDAFRQVMDYGTIVEAELRGDRLWCVRWGGRIDQAERS